MISMRDGATEIFKLTATSGDAIHHVNSHYANRMTLRGCHCQIKL